MRIWAVWSVCDGMAGIQSAGTLVQSFLVID